MILFFIKIFSLGNILEKLHVSIQNKSYSYVYTNMHASKDRLSITYRYCWMSLVVVIVVVVVVAVVDDVMFYSVCIQVE